MEEKTGGKRLTAAEGGKGKLPLIITGVVAGLLLAAYLGLCAYAGRDTVWPNTTVMGVDVSGLTAGQAEERVAAALPEYWVADTLTFYRDDPDKTVASIDTAGLMEAKNVAETLWETQGGSGFLGRGMGYLTSLLGRETALDVDVDFTAEGESRVNEFIDSLARQIEAEGNDTTWTVGEDAVTFTKGHTAARVDREVVRQGIANGLLLRQSAISNIRVSVAEAPPAEPDYEAIRDGLYTEPADAYLDRESREVVESVIGKDLDIEAARSALSATAEGRTCKVPINLTEPAMTTEELNTILFRDVLGEAVTRVSGTSDRIMNVGVAADFINDTILFPGDEFSYNLTCSPYAEDNGYGKATAYVNGLSKDTVAGGICQGSSTLYWATLRANLETVERHPHGYEPSYIKGGLDATVYGDYGEDGSLDFRFKNNTDHPIRLEGYMDSSRYLHMVIWGTDTTGIHGEPYSTNRVVTREYKTLYEPSASVPQGTNPRKDPERTGYTGVSIDTYQKLVDADGATVSETKLYTTRYRYRDEVLLYNPADAELWGIDPATGIRSEPVIEPVESEIPAEGSPAPPVDTGEPLLPPESGGEGPVLPPTVETADPIQSEAPAESEAPIESETPIESQAPAESESPIESEAPAESGVQDAGEALPGSLSGEG